jgi:hypothetical protein
MCGIDALVDVELFMAEADKEENGSIDLFELMAYTNKHKLQMQARQKNAENTAEANLTQRNGEQATSKQSGTSGAGVYIGSSRFVIDPNAEWSQWFELFVSVLLLTTVFTMPLCLAFPAINEGAMLYVVRAARAWPRIHRCRSIVPFSQACLGSTSLSTSFFSSMSRRIFARALLTVMGLSSSTAAQFLKIMRGLGSCQISSARFRSILS